MSTLRRILVVDGSRVVRATLTKHLKDDFAIREENNGESAWQTLVLDSTIIAVISCRHPPKLDAQELLQRLRSNPLKRLNELPFLLIASDTDSLAGQGVGGMPGVAGFITRIMSKDEIVWRLRDVLAAGERTECQELPELLPEATAVVVPAPVAKPATLLSRDEVEKRITQALSSGDSPPGGICALMFGILNHDALIDQFGEEVAEELGLRFANLLLAKIKPHDCIARYSDERIVIVSSGVDLAQCARFAKRVCQSVASGQIAIRGQQIKLSATAGAAASVEPEVTSGKGLLALASQRLDRALACGNNAVVIDSRVSCPLHNAGLLLPRMLTSLSVCDDKAIAARIGTLGMQILPLLNVMNAEFSLGLSLPEIKRQLQQRAQAESCTASADCSG